MSTASPGSSRINAVTISETPISVGIISRDSINVKMTGNVDRYGAGAQQMWELFASMLSQNGFNIELAFQEYGSYIQSTYLGDIAEGIGGGPLIGSPRDPNDIFSPNMESSSARHNWGGTPIDEMPEIDADLAAQRKIFDVEERVAFIQDIQRKMAESMLVVPYTGGAGLRLRAAVGPELPRQDRLRRPPDLHHRVLVHPGADRRGLSRPFLSTRTPGLHATPAFLA
jgi:hypothetical protein